MSLYDGEKFHTESPTPARACAGTAEKVSPIKLGELRMSKVGYVVTGVSVYDIHALLDSAEGENIEWFGDKLVIKVDAPAKDQGAQWVIADYTVAFRGHGWSFGRTTHLPSINCATIPHGHGFFRPGRPALTLSQATHAMAPKPMPQWVLEVEWTSLANAEDKGFRKISETLFNQVGSDGSRIEEAWLLCLPNMEGMETADIVEEPEDEHAFIQPQDQQPDEKHVFLAVLRREAGAWPAVSYYDIVPNRRFVPPWYSVLAPQGPAGQPGAPSLSTNINLVDAPPAPVEQQL